MKFLVKNGVSFYDRHTFYDYSKKKEYYLPSKHATLFSPTLSGVGMLIRANGFNNILISHYSSIRTLHQPELQRRRIDYGC